MAELTFSWRQPPLFPRGNAPKTSDLQFFQVSCAFSVFCSVSYVACDACALSSVYLLFIFVQFEFCVFVLNKMFTIKLLGGRGLRDASDVLHPCKKQRIKPWRPMLYWTELRSTCIRLMLIFVVLSCLRVVRRPQETSYPGCGWFSKTISFF